MTVKASSTERRGVGESCLIDVGAATNQKLDDVKVTSSSSTPQRRRTFNYLHAQVHTRPTTFSYLHTRCTSAHDKSWAEYCFCVLWQQQQKSVNYGGKTCVSDMERLWKKPRFWIL